MFKKLLSGLAWLWRQINPTADNAFSMMIRLVATDLVREYISHNPDTPKYFDVAKRVSVFVMDLRKIFPGLKETTAERIVRAAMEEIFNLAGYNPPEKVK